MPRVVTPQNSNRITQIATPIGNEEAEAMIIRQQRLIPVESWSLPSTQNFRASFKAGTKMYTNGARSFNGSNHWVYVPPRSIDLNDVAMCMWVYIDSACGDCYLFRSYSSGTRRGFNIYRGITSNYIQLLCGVSGSSSSDTKAYGNLTLDSWNFVVVNLDRDGQGQVFVNDMTTPVIDADISDSDDFDWDSGFGVWGLGSSSSSAFLEGRMCKVGLIAGSLFSETERVQLYNNGNGLFWAEMPAALQAKFSGQDYWNMNEGLVTEDCVNSATPARTATEQNSVGVISGPREATAGDMVGGHHGTLIDFGNTIDCWRDKVAHNTFSPRKACKKGIDTKDLGDPITTDSFVAPYNLTIGTTANVAAQGANQPRDFLNTSNHQKLRQNGTLKNVRMYVTESQYITEFKIKVWRGEYLGEYDLVGESADLSGSLVDGTQTLEVNIPNCQVGDRVGVYVNQAGVVNNCMCAQEHTDATERVYYINGEAADTGVEWHSQSWLGLTITMECTMDTPQMVGIGDSLMAGHVGHYPATEDSNSWNLNMSIVDTVCNALGYTCQNMGIGGQTATQIEARFDDDVVSLQPNALLLISGVNDIAIGHTQATYETKIHSMMRKCREAQIRPYVIKILPWTNGTTLQMQERDSWNRFLDTLPSFYPEVVVIDLESTLGQFRSGGDAGNFWDLKPAYDNDGVHPSEDGYQAAALEVQNQITAASAPGTPVKGMGAEMFGFADQDAIDAAHVDGPAGLSPYAINFSGSQYLQTVGIDGGFELGSKISLSAWVKLETPCSASTYAFIVQNDLISMAVRDSNGYVHIFYDGGANYENGTINIKDGQWHHIAVTLDTTNDLFAIYVDGVEDTSGAANHTTAGNDGEPITIGRWKTSNIHYTKGDICDVRVYDRQITETEAAQLTAKTDVTEGLIYHWPMSEGPRSLPSLSGGNCLYFNSGERVTSDSELGNYPKLTFAAWVNRERIALSEAIISHGYFRRLLYVSGTGKIIGYVDNDSGTDASTTSGNNILPANQWHHIAMTYDDDGDRMVRLFLDGELVTDVTIVKATGTLRDTTGQPAHLGVSSVTPDNPYNGYIDDPRIYDEVLSDADILALAQGGEASVDPLAHWTLDDGPQGGTIADGDPICSWESNFASDPFTFYQSTLADRPTYDADNGCAVFGASHALRGLEALLAGEEGCMQIVLDADDTGTYAWLSQSAEASTNLGYIRTAGDKAGIITDDGDTTLLLSSSVTTTSKIIISFWSDGSTIYCKTNDDSETLTVSLGANDGEWFGDMAGLTNTMLGAIDNGSETLFADGDIYEVRLWDGEVDTDDIDSSIEELMAVYSIS